MQVWEGGEEAVGSRTRRAAHRASGAEVSDDDSGGEQVRTVLERGVPLAKRSQCATSPLPSPSPCGVSLLLLLLLPACPCGHKGGTARLVVSPSLLPPLDAQEFPRARACVCA